MRNPRGIGGEIKSRPFARCNNTEPRRNAIGITGEQNSEATGKVCLEGVVLRLAFWRRVVCHMDYP
jgi:hypothetical protein